TARRPRRRGAGGWCAPAGRVAAFAAAGVLYGQVASTKRRGLVLVGGFVVFVALVAVLFAYLVQGGPVGIAVALVVAVATSAGAYWKSDAVALRMSRARPAPEDQYPRYHNLVEDLCIASGLPKPRLIVIEDPAPNASS